MTSYAELAREALQRDPCLQAVLAQDLLNARGLAKRIQQEEGLDEEKIDSIANAIRRYGKQLDPTTFEQTDDWLTETRVEARQGIGALTLNRSPEVLRNIERLHRSLEIDRGEMLEIFEDQASITVLLEESRMKKARELFEEDQEDAVRHIHPNLTSIDLVPPNDEGASDAVLQRVLGCLLANGFQSHFTISSPTRVSILVPRRVGTDAFDAVERLTAE